MAWKEDIQAWINSQHDSPTKNQFIKTERVAIRGGWSPKKYKSSMKKSLHNWLTDWYTLSVKSLPSPATARKNPIKKKLLKKCKNCGNKFKRRRIGRPSLRCSKCKRRNVRKF